MNPIFLKYFSIHYYVTWSQDGVVCTVTTLRARRQWNCGSIPRKGKNLKSASKESRPAVVPHRLTETTIQLILWTLPPAVKRSEGEADKSSPSNPRLGPRKAILPPSHMPSKRGQIKYCLYLNT